jgi:hypothetical protein
MGAINLASEVLVMELPQRSTLGLRAQPVFSGQEDKASSFSGIRPSGWITVNELVKKTDSKYHGLRERLHALSGPFKVTASA